MKTKKVNRYYCDHCNKGGCSAGHMKSHERGCTANPNRSCRVCHMPTDLGGLKEFIKSKSESILNPYTGENYSHLPKGATQELRDRVDGCPACTLAALRQSKTFAEDFRFKEELDAWWKNRDSEKWEKEMHSFRYA